MYRAAWVVAFIMAVVALFTLGRTDIPRLSQEPATFDGAQAATDLRTLALGFPQRVAGSDADSRAGLWVMQQFKAAGLETHIDTEPATVAGRAVAFQTVWAVSRGPQPGTIIVIANRDVPPLATQGANDNASGVADMLELARIATVTAHQHPMVFVCTSGDAYGALGARQFAQRHDISQVLAVIALRRVATVGDAGIGLDGWSPAAKAAPPWLWLLAAPAARTTANAKALLPGVATQILRLAVPTSSGGQAPFVAHGVPGISLSWSGRRVAPPADTVDTVSTANLTRVGSTATAMLLAIDEAPGGQARSGGTIFLTHQRTLPGGALAFILAVLLLPLVAVTVDLYAHSRRAHVRLGPAWKRAALHLAPWLLLIAIVYLANLAGLLPKSPGAVIPPDSHIVAAPRYLRVAGLVLVLLLAYAYAVAVERRLERRVATDPRATILVAHVCLLAIALLVLLVNPYSLLLILPAAMLWPLARPGGWARSLVPVYCGLAMIAVSLVYFAAKLGIGWKVWWFFFLLVENRTIPAGVVLLGVVFVSTAGLFAHALHDRTAGAWTASDAAVPPPGDTEQAADAGARQAAHGATRPGGAARARTSRRREREARRADRAEGTPSERRRAPARWRRGWRDDRQT